MTHPEQPLTHDSIPRSAAGGRQLRAHERYDWNERCEVSWLAEGQPTEPRLLESVDLGLGGVSLIASGPVEVGTLGAVLLLGKGQGGRIRFVEIVHSRFDPSLQAHILGGKWIPHQACADRLIIERTKLGPQLAIRQSDASSSADRGAA